MEGGYKFMSKTIDERVVEMRFDNKQFESNVATSMSTIDKLKQKLNFTNSAKSFENLNTAAKKVDMSGLNTGIETVKKSFSALEVMGITALANITNSAVNAGKRIASALTIAPIKTGLQEYETQINAIQTILANTESKGTTLRDVNAALDELNTYADKTIYNFTEMTRNIGTFTAAGVDLNTSVSAIQGIANLAAISGSSSQQASVAMYQLSQALAAGTVKLMDWNSVVNAGMGGEVFQNALMETARIHGVAIDSMIKEQGSFRETLSEGWLTSEILTETLEKFTLTTEGLTEAEIQANRERLKSKGYTDAQIDSIFKLGETATNAATKVKTFSQMWDVMKETAQSGWAQTWEIIIGDFEEAEILWATVSNTLSEIINKSAETRNNVLQGWKDGGGRVMAIEALTNVFEGLISVIKPIKEAFNEIFPPTTAEQLLNITTTIRDLTSNLRLSENNAKKLKSTFKGVFSAFDIGITIVQNVVLGITQLASKILGLGDGFLDITSALGSWVTGLRNSIKESNIFETSINTIVNIVGKAIDKIKEFKSFVGEEINLSGFDNFSAVLNGIWNLITSVGRESIRVISSIGSAIGNAFRNGDINSILDIVNSGLFGSVLLGISKYIKGITESFDGSVKIIDQIKSILGSVEDSLKSFQQNLKAGTLIKIATSIGILAASILVISSIDPNKLAASLGAITVLFGELIGAMALFEKIADKGTNALSASAIMISLSFSVLILAKSLKQIAELNWNQLAIGLTGVLGLMAIIVAAGSIMSANGKKIKSGSVQMVIMASSLKILSSVCEDLSNLKWSELGKGISGIGALLLEMVGFQALLKKINPKKMLSSATSLILIGTAMEIFADVCSKFGRMQWNDLGKAGVAISGILTISAGFELLSGKANKMIYSSSALILIGTAIEIFADVCNKFGKLKWEELGKAGAAISGLLILSSGFMLLSGLSNNMFKSVISLTVIGAAMEIFSDVCNKFGKIKWEELGKAGTAIGGILLLVSAFGFLSGLSGNMLSSSAALLIMAGALSIITPVLTTLGGMTWVEIAKGIIAIAGAFTVIGVAGMLLGPLVPVILGLSAAIALFGVGCLSVGAGVLALSASFTALATAGAAGATAFVAALTIITVGILQLIPSIVNELTAAVIAICDVIIQSAPAIGEAIKALVLTSIDVIVECIPAIADGVLRLIIGVLEAVKTYIPQIVTILFEILKTIVESAVSAMSMLDSEIFVKGIAALTALMLALNVMASLAAGAMIGILAMGAVVAELALVLAAIGALAQIPGLEWLISEGGTFMQAIGTAIGQFIGGIVGGIAEGVTSVLPGVATNLSTFMTNLTPFIEGAKMIDGSVLTNVQSLAKIIMILTGAGLIEGITSWLTGGSSLSKFGEQLVPFGKAIKDYGAAVSGIDTSGIQASVDAGRALSELASVLPNSGGVAGFFAGENDLDEFAEKLVPFGKAIKEYGDTVSGINTAGIQASVDAGQLLAELADVIPNTGGLVGFIVGENDLDEFGTKFVVFGKAIKTYGDTVANINTAGIQESVNAGYALAELGEALPNSGGVAGFFAGDNDFDTFGTNLEKFGKSLVNFSNTIGNLNISDTTSKLSGFAKSLSTLGKTGVDGFVEAFSDGSSKITSAAVKMITTFVDAAKAKQSTITSTFETIMNSCVTTIRGMYSSFYNAGGYLVQGFANGITANTYIAEARARAMARAATNAANAELGIDSPSKVFMNIGRYVLEGFEEGISDTTQMSSIINATENLANEVITSAQNAFGINSPSRAFMAIGRYIGEGLAQGIRDSAWQSVYWTEDTAKKVKDVASMSFEDIEKWVSDAKSFDELSLAEELEIWEAVIAQYGEGTEEWLKANQNAYSVYKEMQKEDFDASKNWIENEKNYNRLSTKEELEAWQRVQARYIEGTEERKEADSQVYKLKHELIDGDITLLEQEIAKQDALISTLEEGTVEYANAVKERQYLNSLLADANYENSMSYIEDKDFYSRDGGLAEKLAERLRVLNDHKDNKEIYETEAKEVYEIQKEIYETQQQYYEDVEKVHEEFNEKKLELDEEYADKTKEINEKLQEDIQAAEEKYTSELENRTKTLYDSYGLFDEVEKKEEISGATLMDNLRDQVDEFNDWRDTLNSLSARGLNEGLIDELSEMGPSAIAEIKALNSMSDSQLQQYATLWSTKHKLAKEQATFELEDLRLDTQAEIELLKIQAAEDLEEYNEIWNQKMYDLKNDTIDQLVKLKDEFEKTVGLVKVDTEAQIAEMTASVNNILLQAGWDETGEQIVNGIAEGIQSNSGKLSSVITNVTNNSILKPFMSLLGFNSPSRVFAEMGKYTVEGFINGIRNSCDKAVKMTTYLGNTAINSMSESISKIADVINGDMEFEPTIRPVMDLSDVTNGVGSINSMFRGNRGMALSAAVSIGNQNAQNSQAEMFGKIQEMSEKTNLKFTSAIDSLRNDFNNLSSKLEQMQVVMDTGALVGAIAPNMDNALGGLAKMNRRRVR